jgi:hypothetical protein
MFKWNDESREAFKKIKEAISSTPVLVSLDYNQDFQIFSFASEDTIAGVLLQKNEKNMEQPIAFMSKALRDSAKVLYHGKTSLCFSPIFKTFQSYVGYSKIIAYVPHSTVKDILMQQDCLGIQGKWVSKDSRI